MAPNIFSGDTTSICALKELSNNDRYAVAFPCILKLTKLAWDCTVVFSPRAADKDLLDSLFDFSDQDDDGAKACADQDGDGPKKREEPAVPILPHISSRATQAFQDVGVKTGTGTETVAGAKTAGSLDALRAKYFAKPVSAEGLLDSGPSDDKARNARDTSSPSAGPTGKRVV